MEEQLISLSVAKLAKEKGFNSGSKNVYIEHINGGKVEYYDDYYTINNRKGFDLSNDIWVVYEAPTQSLLQKWLREKHKLCFTFFGGKHFYSFGLLKPEIKSLAFVRGEEDEEGLYEKALEIALEKALLLIK